jgi:hypothetical protein
VGCWWRLAGGFREERASGRAFLPPPRGWLTGYAHVPRLAPWAAFFRSFGAGTDLPFWESWLEAGPSL